MDRQTAVADYLKNTTPEQRAEIAKHMVVPIRCGGTEYIDGKRHLRLGGWLVPEDVVAQGWDAIHAYQASHERYVLAPRKRRGKG